MREVYFPSCNFNRLAPAAAKAVRGYLSPRMPVAGCCRTDAMAYEPGTVGLYLCQACRAVIAERAPGRFRLKHLVEYLLEDPAFVWPDHSGLTATVQDCWRDRDHPEVHAAVREALRRMKVTVVEMAENREKSVYCGNIHFEPRDPENVALLARYGGLSPDRLPEEARRRLMREQAAKYPCGTVVTACNRCTSCMRGIGPRVIHLMELAMNTCGAD